MMRTKDQDIWDAKEFLVYCAQSHPKAQIPDYVKHLFQSEYGGEHMIEDPEASLRHIREELAGLTEEQGKKPFFDPFCGVFCRMNLSIGKLLSPELMNRIFLVSAKEVPKGARVRLEEKLHMFWELVREQGDLFPFTLDEVERYLRDYGAKGFPAVSHSPEYKEAYSPAYRVVRKDYGRYPELFAAIENTLREKGRVNVAIEGNSGAGKTEAAQLIGDLFECNVFHTDDFFLPPEKRTPERMAQVGGNMDRERFRDEVCEKVKAEQPFSYRVFDCDAMALGRTVEVLPAKVNIFEGAYSMHPDLREYYDIKVFLSIPPQVQKSRILERNGSFMLRRFLEEWIPRENAYFDQMGVREACGFQF